MAWLREIGSKSVSLTPKAWDLVSMLIRLTVNPNETLTVLSFLQGVVPIPRYLTCHVCEPQKTWALMQPVFHKWWINRLRLVAFVAQVFSCTVFSWYWGGFNVSNMMSQTELLAWSEPDTKFFADNLLGVEDWGKFDALVFRSVETWKQNFITLLQIHFWWFHFT